MPSTVQYELEREKLATELEEERRSQKERDERIKEQQMKIHNLSNMVTLSDSDRSSSHVRLSLDLKFRLCILLSKVSFICSCCSYKTGGLKFHN